MPPVLLVERFGLKYSVAADVWSVTSYNELSREALNPAERQRFVG